MLEAFLINALIAGIGITLMTGPLGCFVAWQRMAYFGDTIAHAALLGVALSLLLGAPLELGIIVVALAIAIFVVVMEKKRALARDTLLGVAAHVALALGLVLIALSETITVDISGYLFGDILAVNQADITRIYIVAALVLAFVVARWRALLAMTLNTDIAQVEGLASPRLRLALMLALALVVAISIKLVGMLLITALLIIPAASARFLAKTPTQMAVLATLAGMLAVVGGLYVSLHLDTPAGPSIILVAMGVFVVNSIFGQFSAEE